MRTTRNHLERVIEGANESNIDFIANEIKEVLESNKEYTRKADYLGYSICSLDEKVKLIDEQMNDLKEYKQKLKEAKSLVLEVGAKVFRSYGIEKIEGAGISSITLSKEAKSTKTSIVIVDEKALIDAGFYKLIIDEKAIVESYNNGDYQKLIMQNCKVSTKEVVTPAKLKVNKRRTRRIAS